MEVTPTAPEPRPRDLDELSRLLDQEQDRTALALEACGAGTWDWDVESDDLHWGTGMMRLYGISHFGGRYEDFERCLEPADVAPVRAAVAHAIQHHSTFDCRFRLISRRGVVIRGRGKCYYKDGLPVRMVGVNVEETPVIPTFCPISSADCPIHVAFGADVVAADCANALFGRGVCTFQRSEAPKGDEHADCGHPPGGCQGEGRLS